MKAGDGEGDGNPLHTFKSSFLAVPFSFRPKIKVQYNWIKLLNFVFVYSQEGSSHLKSQSSLQFQSKPPNQTTEHLNEIQSTTHRRVGFRIFRPDMSRVKGLRLCVMRRSSRDYFLRILVLVSPLALYPFQE